VQHSISSDASHQTHACQQRGKAKRYRSLDRPRLKHNDLSARSGFDTAHAPAFGENHDASLDTTNIRIISIRVGMQTARESWHPAK